ncbi:MAG: DUF4013 domain-containing protein [Cyanobacteria bacterium P01_H01_bin.21]
MTDLIRALRYPWQGRRLLPLALWQLIPIVGQIILVGYGQAIVRTIYRQQSGLPKFKLRQSLIDGLRLVAVGLIYCFPIILMVLLTFSTSDAAETTGGISPIFFTVVMLIYLRIRGEIIKRQPALTSVVSIVNRVLTAVFVVFIMVRLYGLFTSLRTGLQFSAIQTGGNLTMLFVALLLLAVVVVALLVSGARFAVLGSSLLKPTTTLQLMAVNRGLSLRLIVTVWLLAAGTLLATVVGAVFMLLPGLLLLAAGNASIWFLVAQYVIKIEPTLSHGDKLFC